VPANDPGACRTLVVEDVAGACPAATVGVKIDTTPASEQATCIAGDGGKSVTFSIRIHSEDFKTFAEKAVQLHVGSMLTRAATERQSPARSNTPR
jgi:hypothetical protein